MKKTTMVLWALAATAMAGTAYAAGKPFGGKDDVDFGRHLWKTLAAERFVGPDSLHPQPYETPPPHGNIVETLSGKITVNGRRALVIVKKNFGERGENRGKTSVADVAGNPDKWMTSVTVMFKREKGYDPDNQNWFWAKYTPSGTLMKNPKGMALAGRVAKGTDKACIACHVAAPGDDYVYTDINLGR